MGDTEILSRFRLALDCQTRRVMIARVTSSRTFQVPRLNTSPGKPEAFWSAMWGVRAEITSSSAVNKAAKPAMRHKGFDSVAGREMEPAWSESDTIETHKAQLSPRRENRAVQLGHSRMSSERFLA